MLRNLIVLGSFVFAAGVASADTFTDFEGFTTGASVDGQGGWSAAAKFDEEVVDDGGNTVWRVSNAVTAGSFGDMPFTPRLGGIPTDTVTDPVNGMPGFFAGETSTGATHKRFFFEFDFKSATGAAQPGLSVTGSADNGQGGRQGFFDIEDNGTGLDVITFDLDNSAGTFIGPITIASGLPYDSFNTLGVEVLFEDGTANDTVNYFVNGGLVHTGQSWEEFYRNFQASSHPLGVPVQALLFRLSGTAENGVLGNGLYIDNVTTQLGAATSGPADPIPEPGTFALCGLVLAGGALARRRRRRRA